MTYAVTVIFISYLLGVIAAVESGSFFFIGAALLVVPVTVIKYHLGRKRGIAVAVYALVFAAAFLNTASRLCPEASPLYPHAGIHYMTVAGRIISVPEPYEDGFRYTVRLGALSCAGETEKLSDTIYVTSPSKLECGDTVLADGFVKLYGGEMNSGSFNAGLSRKAKGIFYRMYSNTLRKAGYNMRAFSLRAETEKLRSKAISLITSRLPQPESGVAAAVVTGNKNYMDSQALALFRQSGAERALHPAFAYIAAILAAVSLFKKRVSKNTRTVIICLLLTAFAAVCSDRPVFVKAALLYIAAMLTKRRYGHGSTLDALCIALLSIGIVNPLMYYNAGLILSSAATLLIAGYTREFPYNKRKISLSRYRLRAMTISLTIGLAPLTLYFFNGITVYSLILSLVLLPVSAAINVIFAAAAPFGIPAVFADSLKILSDVLIFGAGIMKRVPFSLAALPKPDLWFIGAWYCAAGAFMYFRRRRKAAYKTLALLCSICIGISAGKYIQSRGLLEIGFVNVGQGDGALIKMPSGENIIIDGGGGAAYSTYNIGDKIFVPYLQSHNAQIINTAVLSHFDKDHCEGVISAVKSLRVARLYVPAAAEDSDMRRGLLSAAEENNTEVIYVSDAISLTFAHGVSVTVRPALSDSSDSNNSSLITEIGYGGFKALFTGDIESRAEKALTENGLVSDVDVLKAAHHGSATSSTAEFLNAAKPECVVISVGEDNTFSHPSPEVVSRFEALGSKIFRTDENGDIRIRVRSDGAYSAEVLRQNSE